MDTQTYSHRWKAFYKNGVCNTSIIYGKDMDEAMKNALAEYRRHNTMVDFWPIERIVDHVELVD